MEQARLNRLELTRPDSRLRLVRRAADTAGHAADGASAGAAMPGPATPPGENVTARGAGIFLAQHPLRDAPLAPPGRRIARGDVVGLLGIDVLYLPVTASRGGVIGERLAEPGDLVGYGTALFRLLDAS